LTKTLQDLGDRTGYIYTFRVEKEANLPVYVKLTEKVKINTVNNL
jgi:hypothetical protein